MLIRKPEVCRRLGGISFTTLWRLIQLDGFPPPFRLTRGYNAWEEDSVSQWIEDRKKNSTAFPAVKK